MRRPLRSKVPGREPGVLPASIPPPVRGWNTIDSIAAMDPTFAIALDNWFPYQTSVKTRPGAEAWATGFTDRVFSLMTYSSGTNSQFFASTDSDFYDITTAGPVGASVHSVANGLWDSLNFTTGAGVNYLVAANTSQAGDFVRAYNGSSWQIIDGSSTPAITGVNTDDLSNLAVFKNRLWFIERNSLQAWFLPVGAFGGATLFPLSAIFPRGGRLVQVETWTIDGGSGVDDLLVFLTSEGEAAVYKGTDPTSANTFGLVGVYYIGAPAGNEDSSRCLIKYGGDLLYVSTLGVGLFSQLLQSATIDRMQMFSRNIETAFQTAFARSGSELGWQVIQYSEGSFILVNIPLTDENGPYEQYVMNTTNTAWCRFTGWDGTCFGVFDGKLFQGQANRVSRCWTGASDFGSNIVAFAKTAYNYFESRGQQKQWTLYRPIFESTGPLSTTIAMGLSVDFSDSNIFSGSMGSSATPGQWDSALWDFAQWDGATVSRSWRTVFSPPGYCASLRLRIAANTISVSWLVTDYLYKPCTIGAL